MTAHPDEIPETGAVFTFGKSRFADNEPSHFFIKNDPVVAISCGDEHSAVICQQGRVFVFGGNAWGQLGLGHTDEVTRPSCVKWLKPHRALFVACGRAHTVFVTDTHAIYTVGLNADGQLGIGGTEQQSVPQYVELECPDSRVKQVSAGSNHTAILTESGQVFVCGSNTEGQLGLGEGVRTAAVFTELKFVESVAFVECGYYHTVFITAQGVVYVTGENEGQKLGTRNMSPNVYVPEVLPIDTPIKSACCGASHTFLLSMDEAKVLAFGSNEKGQLGLPKSVVEVTEPTEICMEKMFEGYQLKLVACGAMHTAFVTDNGLLYTCGESRNNKLCLDEVDNVDNSGELDQYTPKRVSAMKGFIVDNVACGGCHTLLTATRSADFSTEDFSIATEETRHIPLTELPPLQKIPTAIMNRTSDDNPADGNRFLMDEIPTDDRRFPLNDGIPMEINRILLSDDNNGNPVNCEDTTSMDSLEANVSGSHIVNINDLDNGNGSIHGVPDIETDENHSTETRESVTIIENAIDRIAAAEDTIIKEIVLKPGEKCDEMKSLGIPDKQMETQYSPPPKSPPVPQNLLQLPDGLQMSPDVSRKSEGSPKSETCSKSENETIICGSDNDKSSPVAEKQSKTQAVMPIVRSEDLITSGDLQSSGGPEIVTQKLAEKGRFGKIFQTIRDKENSCMGKGKVIENVVTENVNKGISTAEDTVHKVEETIETEVRNQTNSRACIIL